VQLAREAGAEVIGTASAAHHDFVAALGANVVIDYANDAIERTVRDVDVALDHRGGGDFVRIVNVMRPGGVIATLKGASSAGEALATQKGVSVERVFVQPDGEILQEIAVRLATGALQIAVSRTLPLGEASAAHAIVEQAHGRGRIVLDVTR
jgi:NADPH:quinone reductase-like Zn-dependent oxidoreductase